MPNEGKEPYDLVAPIGAGARRSSGRWLGAKAGRSCKNCTKRTRGSDECTSYNTGRSYCAGMECSRLLLRYRLPQDRQDQTLEHLAESVYRTVGCMLFGRNGVTDHAPSLGWERDFIARRAVVHETLR